MTPADLRASAAELREHARLLRDDAAALRRHAARLRLLSRVMLGVIVLSLLQAALFAIRCFA